MKYLSNICSDFGFGCQSFRQNNWKYTIKSRAVDWSTIQFWTILSCMYSDIKSILCSSLPKFPFTNFQIYEFWKKGFQLYRLSISMLYPKLSISKESSDKHLVGLDFFNRSFLFIYELGIGVYIHMKHSVLVQFIRWLCVQIRPKTDNEQLVCNFFSNCSQQLHAPAL